MKKSSVSWRGLLIVGIAVAALGITYRVVKATRNNAPPAPDSTAESPAEPASEQESSEPREVSQSQFLSNSQLPAVVQSTARSSSSLESPVVRAEPTPYTRQLVASLANLNFSQGPITREQAEQWKQGLLTLTQQGAAAVPAIRQFLEQNQDLNFAAMNGGELLGQSSLRSAFIDALQQIGGPEALDVMLQTLRSTTLPSEIALLARNLEQQSPGQYRHEALNAANDVLAMAEQGKLPGWDVGTLFQMMQSYGDATTAAALVQLQSKWNYYATMSLAQLPEGEGLPNLISQVQDAAAGAGTKRTLAFQMLAQVATQYPEASAALVELARQNQIPDTAWRKIATGLTGDQYQIGNPPEVTPTTPAQQGLKTYHIESGNQNFYSLPLSPTLPPDQISQRLALLDQLQAVASTPVAVDALQNARALLSSYGQSTP